MQTSDMNLRIWNYANRRGFHVRFEKPEGSWPATDLYLYHAEGELRATVGDLTVSISGGDLLEIMEIVQRRQAGEIFQL